MSVKREAVAARRKVVLIRAVADALLAKAPGSEHDMIEELIRRGQYVVADGYPTQSMADSDIHGGFAQTGSTSTERAALRLAAESDEDAETHDRDTRPDDWRERERDVAGDALRELVSDIERAAFHMGDADQARKFLLSIQGRRHGRESTVVNCPLCGGLVTNVGNDRIRSGYCLGCYSAWRDAGSPRDPVERSQFERDRLARLKVEQQQPDPHVACPHICCPVDVRRSPSHDHRFSPEECTSCELVRKAG